MQAVLRVQPLRFWSKKEGATRHGASLSLSEETCWADAFFIPPPPAPAAPAPDAEAPAEDPDNAPAGPEAAAAAGPAAPPANPDATAKLQLQAAAVRLCRELPPPPAHIEAALTEALPDLLGQGTDAAVRALLDSPAWPQEANGFWGTAFLAIVLSEGGRGVNKLLAWMWEHAVPSAIGIAEKPGYGASASASLSMVASPASQQQHLQQRSELLNRYHVREFACALLVLLRHKAVARTQPQNMPPAAHDMLCNELVHLEAEDLHSAVRIMQSVPQWRLDGLPLPARNVVMPGGATLTAEQISIIQSVVPFEVTPNGTIIHDRPTPNVIHRVQAFAGCGKTSTLRYIAQAHSGLTFLYCAYNKDVVTSADRSFPRNAEARTSHSLAFAECGRELKPKLVSNMTNSHIQAAVMRAVYNNTNKKLAIDGAECLKVTLERFMTSADPVVAARHVPEDRPHSRDPAKQHNWVELASALWGLMTDPNDPMVCSHNAYLKLCQLKRPVLKRGTGYSARPYDVILVDEAQDLNEVTIDLLLHQPCTKVLVGDRHQHVYSFNHCCNALDRQFEGGRVFQLSCSFRMGPEVNALVNRILRTAKDERRLVLGRGSGSSVVYVPDDENFGRNRAVAGYRQAPLLSLEPIDTPGTPLRLEVGPQGLVRLPPVAAGSPPKRLCYVTRSNAGWLRAAIALAEQRAPMFLAASEGQNGWIPLFDDIRELHKFRYQGRRGKFADWARSWEELKVSPRTKGESLKSAIGIVEAYGRTIMDKIELVQRYRVQDKDAAAYILSTAHKMKGLEEEYVQLADDFYCIANGRHEVQIAQARQMIQEQAVAAGGAAAAAQQRMLDAGAQEVPEDEYNLVYVAASRSLKVLICNKDLAALVTKMKPVSERVQARSRDALRAALRAEQAQQAQLQAQQAQMQAQLLQELQDDQLGGVNMIVGDEWLEAMDNGGLEDEVDIDSEAMEEMAAEFAAGQAAQDEEDEEGGQGNPEHLHDYMMENVGIWEDEEEEQEQQAPAAPAAAAVVAPAPQQQLAQEEVEIALPETRTFVCGRCRGQFVPEERAALDVVLKEKLLCEACVGRTMFCSLWGLPPGRRQRLSL